MLLIEQGTRRVPHQGVPLLPTPPLAPPLPPSSTPHRAEAVKAAILDSEGLAQQRAALAARADAMRFAGYSRADMAATAGAGAPGAAAAAGPGGQLQLPGAAGLPGAAEAAAGGGYGSAPLGPTAGSQAAAGGYRPPNALVGGWGCGRQDSRELGGGQCGWGRVPGGLW